MLTVIDNYDSFTYNLVHYLGELGARARVFRNDKVSAEEALAGASAVILSPGPATPDEAGICLELIRKAAHGGTPLFGVCLGMQAIGQAFGGKVIRAHTIMHGKISTMKANGRGIFDGIPARFTATRYHSLCVERDTLPADLEITAEDESGVIMALSHRDLPIHGVQFHPESIASEHGHSILRNFLNLARSPDI